jgi:tetratricopeptide (TPR) repeat protein
VECPSSDQWLAFTSGHGSQLERAQLAEHAESCAACRELLASYAVAPTTVPQTMRTFAPLRPSQQALLAPGATIGRYVIERTLGTGGMGVVYAAHDPELKRKVAIKLLRDAASGTWLRREAQALAKLDHPNVVAVYDVGEHDGVGFVAMALVEGHTLRQWCATPHSVRDTLHVIIEAGRGLAAAHAAGLIHRDLKPDNVFVSDRVLVGDFGLAVERDAESSGTIAGTPAYMAPEQIRGEPTVLSDQFALCVTAWEALYGTLPFPPATFDDVETRGPLVEPHEDPGVPKRVRRALERGLAADPADRWPSIEALLHELVRDPARQARIAAAVGAGALVLAGGWGIAQLTRSAPDRCRASGARLAEVWTPIRAAEIRTIVARTAPYAQVAIDHAIDALDAYGAHWRAAWDETCRAEASDVGFDLRVACLDQRLAALGGAAAALAATDASNARTASDVPTILPDLAHCGDVASLHKVAPPVPALAGSVAALEHDLATGEALVRAGKYPPGEDIVRRTVRAANALGYEPLQAHAQLVLGRVLMMQGRFLDAKPELARALNYAIAAGDDETIARVYVATMRVAIPLGDKARVNELHDTADAALHRAGDPAAQRAFFTAADATLPLLAGDYNEALARVERVIPKLEADQQGAAARTLYRMHSALLAGLGRIDDARVAYDHEVADARERLGTKHPDYADAQLARGKFLFVHERYADGIADIRAGYAGLIAALGPDAPSVIDAGTETVMLDRLFGHTDAAIAKLQRAIDAPGRSLMTIASYHRQLGSVLVGAGRLDEAERELARATELDRNDPTSTLVDELEVSQLRSAQKRYGEARAILDRVEPALRKALGADNPALTDVALTRADIALAEGHPADVFPPIANIKTGLISIAAHMLRVHAYQRLGDKASAAAERTAALAEADKIGPDAMPSIRAELAR